MLSLLILDLTSFYCGYLWLFTFTALEGFKESSWHWRGYHFSCFIYTAIYVYRGIYTFKGIYISISDSILSQGSGKLQIPGLIFLQKVSFLMPVTMKWLRGLNLGSSEHFGEYCKGQVMGNTDGQVHNVIKGVWWHHKPERQICSRRNFVLSEWMDMIFWELFFL